MHDFFMVVRDVGAAVDVISIMPVAITPNSTIQIKMISDTGFCFLWWAESIYSW